MLIQSSFNWGMFSHSRVTHQFQIDNAVGATQHIEPNDTPRKGKLNTVWFKLTHKGGKTIPLSACDCKLSVYHQPRQVGDTPIQEPVLRSFAAEGFEGIPTPEVIFPKVGAYELVLTGKPYSSGMFDALELRFEVTVAQGAQQIAPDSETVPEDLASNSQATDPELANSQPEPTIEAQPESLIKPQPVTLPAEDVTLPIGLGILVGGLVLTIAWTLRPRKRNKSHDAQK